MLDTCFYISLSFFPPFPLPYFIDVLQWTGGLLLILCQLKNMRNSRRSKWSLIFWIWFLGIQGKHSFFSSVAPAWWGWRAGSAEADFQFVVFTMPMTTCCRTSADLFKTVFDLLVSVTVFLGRFDMRMMQV